jgi:Uroporphyrinogen-III synthase
LIAAALSPLRGRQVLVTRPAIQATGQSRLIQAAGGSPIEMPLVVIGPPADPEAAASALGGSYDGIVFTSSNAVRAATVLHPAPWEAPVYAAGPGTARALGDGVAVQVPARDGAEGLLSLPALREPRGRRLLIVCGADPLPDLAAGLRARGAEVVLAEVYRRRLVPYAMSEVERHLARADAAIVTSGGALERLLGLATEAGMRECLLALPLVVPSTRVADQAVSAGLQLPPLLPERVSDEAMVQALISWCQQSPDARK